MFAFDDVNGGVSPGAEFQTNATCFRKDSTGSMHMADRTVRPQSKLCAAGRAGKKRAEGDVELWGSNVQMDRAVPGLLKEGIDVLNLSKYGNP
ncbi:hypothetical protein FRX31_007896 [Thalictrum thalictroides]|uniref:Uncharacterized protein n=1 Tax=Thalictrum thalictroides TaxID=46969 RepID=A0A7J6X0F9_THATH|nr:hypothetical protein FRX31_007896 [Thalictrum thalictroides]